MRRQELQSTGDKIPDTDLEDKIKTNVVFCTTVYPIKKEGRNILLRYMRTVPPHFK